MTALEIGTPATGFYRRRLVKAGPWVPVHLLAVHRPGKAPRLIGLQGLDTWLSDAECLQAWTWLQPIPEAEYRHMVRDAAWCRTWAPDAPEANPQRQLDLGEMAPVF